MVFLRLKFNLRSLIGLDFYLKSKILPLDSFWWGNSCLLYNAPSLSITKDIFKASTLQSITDMHGIPINQMPQRLAHQTHLDCYSQGQKI